MYGIITYIYHKNHQTSTIHVGRYTIHGWYGLVTASNPTGVCSIPWTHAGWFRRLSDGASLLLGPNGGCGGWVGRSLVWNVPGTNQGDKQTYTQPRKFSFYIIAYLILCTIKLYINTYVYIDMLYMVINMVLVVAQISFGVTNFREAQRWKVNLLVT